MACVTMPGTSQTFCGCVPNDAFTYTDKLWLAALVGCGRCYQRALSYRTAPRNLRTTMVEQLMIANEQERLLDVRKHGQVPLVVVGRIS
jgi:hypothetical protein